MNFFDAEHVCTVIAGRWLQRPHAPRSLTGIGIDSRQDLDGKAFVAIRGERHDGHDFLPVAAHKGARLLIVERQAASQTFPPDVGIIEVESTRAALMCLASAYRDTLRKTTVIAITGSVGKTTTKELLHAVLTTRMRGATAPKSYNNDIGVPLTILQARPDDQFLTVELGTNSPGEIAALAGMVRPDVAVITSVGRAHLQGLGSMEGIAREKSAVLTHLRPGGTAVVTADAPLLRPFLGSLSSTVLYGLAEDADLRLTRYAHEGAHWWFEVNSDRRFALLLPGLHNALNGVAVVAVAQHLGLSDALIAAGLKRVQPLPMRMELRQIAGVTVCNDAYNANPESVRAALDVFAEVAQNAPRRIIIFGDMLELGEAGENLHREIGRWIADLNSRLEIHQAVFIGELSGYAAEGAEKSLPGDRITVVPALDDEVCARIVSLFKPGDAVLVKASRGMGLERLVAALQSRATLREAASRPFGEFSTLVRADSGVAKD